MAPLNIAFDGTAPKPISADTLVVYLIDRSGSMFSCWPDTIGGYNADVEKLREENAEGTDAALFVFDSSNRTTHLDQVYWGPLSEAPILDPRGEFQPRGGTPLYDSVGRLVEMIRARVELSDPKPNVLVTILTDGANTDNRGYSAEQVKYMIEERQGKGWTFTYLGANQNAWAVGASFGIAAGNTMSYGVDNMAATMVNLSAARSAYVGAGKMAKNLDPSAVYSTTSFFADAGQTPDDYK